MDRRPLARLQSNGQMPAEVLWSMPMRPPPWGAQGAGGLIVKACSTEDQAVLRRQGLCDRSQPLSLGPISRHAPGAPPLPQVTQDARFGTVLAQVIEIWDIGVQMEVDLPAVRVAARIIRANAPLAAFAM